MGRPWHAIVAPLPSDCHPHANPKEMFEIPWAGRYYLCEDFFSKHTLQSGSQMVAFLDTEHRKLDDFTCEKVWGRLHTMYV
jgi:hypothetical protein